MLGTYYGQSPRLHTAGVLSMLSTYYGPSCRRVRRRVQGAAPAGEREGCPLAKTLLLYFSFVRRSNATAMRRLPR